MRTSFSRGTEKSFNQIFSLSINLKIYSCGGYAAFFVFPLAGAAEKHLISEKPQCQNAQHCNDNAERMPTYA